MEAIIFAGIFILLCAICLYVILKPYFKDKRVRNGVVNFDTSMRSYCFVLSTDKQGVIEKLSHPSIYDEPEYSFDDTNLIITFMHLNAKIKYQLYFIEKDNRIYLNVYRINLLHDRSSIPYMINAFWINKIGAIPVEYSFFKTIQSESMPGS